MALLLAPALVLMVPVLMFPFLLILVGFATLAVLLCRPTCGEILIVFPSMPGSLGFVHLTRGVLRLRDLWVVSDPRDGFLVVAFCQLKPSNRPAAQYPLLGEQRVLVGVARPSYPDASCLTFSCGVSAENVPPPFLQREPNRWCKLHLSTLGTLSSSIPGVNTSIVTDQPRVGHVTLDSLNVILVFHKNFEGSAHGSHGLIHAFNCSVAL